MKHVSFMPGLIGSDLDGTLLGNDRKVSAFTGRVIASVAAMGIPFVPVTGRPFHGLPPSVRSLTGLRYVITSNGATTVDLATGGILRSETLSPGTALAIGERISDIPGLLVEVFHNGWGYHDPVCGAYVESCFRGTELEDYIRMSRKTVPDLRGFLEQLTEEWESEQRGIEDFSVMSETPEAGDEVMRRLSAMPGMRVVRPSALFIEAGSARCDKGLAFLALADYLKIPREKTAAFGDADNDRGLLHASGLGIAVKNADPALFSIADRITETNDEDGVAREIIRMTGISLT